MNHHRLTSPRHAAAHAARRHQFDVAATDESADVEIFMPDSPTIEYDVVDSTEANIEETIMWGLQDLRNAIGGLAVEYN